MRDFPSCFGESGVQVADCSSTASKTAQNSVTCLYHARLSCRPSSVLISVTWSKNLMGQGLSIGIDESKVDIKPWLFAKRKGSKCFQVDGTKVEIFWDLSNAKFAAGAGAEPLEGFYVAVVFDLEMVLLLGDMTKDAMWKTAACQSPKDTVFVARREHICGKKVYSAKARFGDNGRSHDIEIECDMVGSKDPYLEIRLDKKTVVLVKRLAWKFRGNQTIMVDGVPVEVFWDVHSWLFVSPTASAVFMFRSCRLPERSLPWQRSVLPRDQSQLQGHGFSLVLHAWRSE